jgi:hypothetical protein
VFGGGSGVSTVDQTMREAEEHDMDTEVGSEPSRSHRREGTILAL